MAITTQMRTEISQLYVALFGRAPDGEGLGFWVNLRDQGRSLVDIANTMYATTPARTYFPTFLTNQEIIGAFYTNVLGRTADSEGLAFWTAKLNAPGATPGSVIAEMINVVANYTGTNQDGKDSQALFNNRVQVAQYYAEKNGTVSGAIAVLNGVSKDVATVASVKTAIDNGTVGGVNQGQNYVLTVNQDAGAAFTGTTGNDVFLAGAAQDGNGNLINTLQSVDVLDGGGGIDALQVTLALAGNFAPTLRNIETIEARAISPFVQLDLSNATGVTGVTIGGSQADMYLANIGPLASLAIRDQVTRVTIGGAAGSATGLDLLFDRFGVAGAYGELNLGGTEASRARTAEITITDSAVRLDSTHADAFTTAHIVASGTNEIQFIDSGSTLETVEVSGSGSLLFGGEGLGALRLFDASACTGAVSAYCTGPDGLVVKTGSGADAIGVGGGGVQASVSLGAGDDVLVARTLDGLSADGGTGHDVLHLDDGASLNAANAARMMGFEALDFTLGQGQFDLAGSGFSALQVDQRLGNGLDDDVVLDNCPDGLTLTFISRAGPAAFGLGGHTLTINGADYTGTTAAGTGETVTFAARIHDTNANGVQEGSIGMDGQVTMDGVETLVFDLAVATPDTTASAAQARPVFSLWIAAADAERIVVRGDVALDLTRAHAIGNLRTVDASASTAAVAIDMSQHARAVAFTGGTGDDAYIASTAGDTFYGGAGCDTFSCDDAQAARDTVVIRAAGDTPVRDDNGDGRLTIAQDSLEVVSRFDAAAGPTGDRIDVTALGFAGAQRGVLDVTARVGANTDITSLAGLFADAATGQRGVAFTRVGANCIAFVDCNKDGNFDAASDACIYLVGVDTLSEANINF